MKKKQSNASVRIVGFSVKGTMSVDDLTKMKALLQSINETPQDPGLTNQP